MIQSRNPIYKVKEHSTDAFERLQNKDLIGIDVQVQGQVISIRKKQKFIVMCKKDAWWFWGEDDAVSVHIHLYSLNRIMISDGVLSVRFSYRNEVFFCISEEEILALIPVRRKAKREDEDIQQMIQSMYTIHAD